MGGVCPSSVAYPSSHSLVKKPLTDHPLLWSCITCLIQHPRQALSEFYQSTAGTRNLLSKVKGSGHDPFPSPRSIRYPFSVAGGHGLSSPRQTATPQAPSTACSLSRECFPFLFSHQHPAGKSGIAGIPANCCLGASARSYRPLLHRLCSGGMFSLSS